MQKLGLLALTLGIAAVSQSIAQNQIPLDPSAVVGGTNPYSPQFANSNVLDAQSGDISEPTQNGYWLNPDGAAASQDAYIVIGVGQECRLTIGRSPNRCLPQELVYAGMRLP